MCLTFDMSFVNLWLFNLGSDDMAITAERERSGAATGRPGSVVEWVYDSIYERLMSLEIAPGARLPIDLIARNLDVSQTPVREALSRLETEGLVRKAHLIGYSAAPQHSRKQFEDLFDFRLLVEPDAARNAAARMDEDALARLDAMACDMSQGEAPVDRTSRYSRFARTDAVFHDEILKIAGNAVVRRAMADQHVHLHLFRLLFHSRVTQEALTEHEAIMDAFRRGDATAAEHAMREHITRSRGRLMLAFE